MERKVIIKPSILDRPIIRPKTEVSIIIVVHCCLLLLNLGFPSVYHLSVAAPAADDTDDDDFYYYYYTRMCINTI